MLRRLFHPPRLSLARYITLLAKQPSKETQEVKYRGPDEYGEEVLSIEIMTDSKSTSRRAVGVL